MIFKKLKISILSLLFSGIALAEMQPLDDRNLGNVNAQNGISLSGSFDLNTSGGPKWDYNRDGSGNATTCTTNAGKCGARFALKASDAGGWFILDDIRGGFSFGESASDPNAKGLEVAVKTNNTATSNGTSKEVLEFGLPSVINYDNVNFTVATGASAELNTQQTNIMSIQINGPVVTEGKLLVFP